MKGLEALEILDKLEECAYAMKDLPMSNWGDLAENEFELDLKIMDWVETIKIELLKGKQALTELKAIKEAKSSEAMESLERIDKEYATIEHEDFKICFNTIKQALLKAQEQEKENKVLKACIKDWEDDYEHLKFASEKKEKALEIIKEKCYFMPLSKIKNLSYDLYVRWFDLNHYDIKSLLTREEFDLLKEVFCNDISNRS